jgi:hypothetical protein
MHVETVFWYSLHLCSFVSSNSGVNTVILHVCLLWLVLCSNKQISLTSSTTKCVTTAKVCLYLLLTRLQKYRLDQLDTIAHISADG